MPFSRGIQEIHAGKIMAPVLRAELMKPRFRNFSVKIDKFTPRPPDGWFHPSVHSDWPARKLTLYLRNPELLEEEDPTLEKVIAVTQGHFFHTLVGKILIRNGILKRTEIYKEDPIYNRRGHMDGELEGEGWEFKTMNNDFLLKKVFSAEDLIQHKPGYFSQAQDYMDMHGLPRMRYLIMGMFFPYPMNEFVVERDDGFIARQQVKYQEALEAHREGVQMLPERCCEHRSKDAKGCEMAAACPVGRAALGMPTVRAS